MTQEFKPSVRAPGVPVQEFEGVLDEWKSEISTYGDKASQIILFNFKDLDIIKSSEPYSFPILVIRVKYTEPSDRGRAGEGNRWEVFANSLRKLIPDGADLDQLVGKKQTWAMKDAVLRLPLYDDDDLPKMIPDKQGRLDGEGNVRMVPEWGDRPDPCWQIVSVDGLGSVKEADEAQWDLLVGLADGMDEKKFYELAYNHEEVRSNKQLVQDITDRKLLSGMLDSHRLTRDADGILHKVVTDAPVTWS